MNDTPAPRDCNDLPTEPVGTPASPALESVNHRDLSAKDAELYERCVKLVRRERKASTALLQRRFSIGYGKAALIMDIMEEKGIVGPSRGCAHPREVLPEE